MSWLVQVPKTIEYIIEHPYEILLFIRPITKYVKSALVTSIESKDVETMTFGSIKEYINDPGYILIKIDINKEDNNGKD